MFFLILFFAVGTDKPITFLIKAIRKCRIPKSDPHIFKVYIHISQMGQVPTLRTELYNNV